MPKPAPDLVLPAPAPVLLALADGSGAFAVRRVYCVGRNYAEHAREMGASGREQPFFFAKPADAILNVGAAAPGRMAYPPATQDLHHELELVVALGSGGRNLSVAAATDCIWGYAIGLDMTRRDLQAEAKKLGRPWETAKGFDQSAPIGPLHRRSATGLLQSGALSLKINGALRQSGDLADMIWSVPEAIASLSSYFELRAGDLLFTGTPAGVGAVKPGDFLECQIEKLGAIELEICA